MPETRHRTVVEIGVDDRQVRNLGQTMGRTFDERTLRTFETSIDRAARAMERMLATAVKLETALVGIAKASGGVGGGGGGRPGGGGFSGGPGGFGGPGNAALLAAIQGLTAAVQNNTSAQTQHAQAAGGTGGPGWAGALGAGYLGGKLSSAGSNIGGGQMLAGTLGSIPIIGGFFSGAIQQIQSLYQEFAQVQTARAHAFGAYGRQAGPLSPQFARYGFSSAEAPGLLSGMAQRTGMTGASLSPSLVGTLLQMQVAGGLQNAGAILGAGGVAGGAVADPEQLLMQAVSSGLASGVREARLDQYLTQIAGTVETMRTQGLDISTESVIGMVQGFRAIGGAGSAFRGEAASSAARSHLQAITQLGRGGSHADIVALRAAGFGSGKSYHQALETLENDPQSILPRVLEILRSSMRTQDPERRRHALAQYIMDQGQQYFGRRVAIREALAIADADPSSIRDQIADTTTNEADAFFRRRQNIEGMGTARTEAGYRNRRVDAGEDAAGAAVSMRNFELTMTSRWLGPLSSGIQRLVAGIENLVRVFEAEGLTGMLREALSGLTGMFAGVVGEGVAAVGRAAGIDMRGFSEHLEELRANPSDRIGEILEGASDIVGGANPATAVQRSASSAAREQNRRSAAQGGGPVWNSAAGYSREAAEVDYAAERSRIEANPQPAAGDGPTSSAADYLRRAEEALRGARGALDGIALPSESAVAAYG